ncbi:ATP-binding protein [Haliangium ochraceum]|uniref:histidine kinase n=1 Tax=Haliangium ochraceum (strain DSM 14365 / JCM 11303 / SMP-2) TaxID=502025 RepID=D0LJ79_HALO1|nr:ATP-binding protein [Haliangium ochraceum]ACY14926.1 integral membrane sensor signal transduction histidine kinase [Haliangium ochraceum DSM 14365]
MALFGESDDLDPTVAPSRRDAAAAGLLPELAFRRRLLFISLAMIAAELLLVGVPLWLLFELGSVSPGALARAGLPVLLLGSVAWLALMGVWFAPIHRALRAHRRDQQLEPEVASAAYRASLSLPLKLLVARAALWSVGALLVGLLLIGEEGRGLRLAAAMGSVALLHAWVVGILQTLSYGGLLSLVRLHMFPRRSWLERFADGYFGRLVLVSVIVFGAALAAFLAFVHYFLPISVEQYLLVAMYFPPAAVLGVLVWLQMARRITSRLRRYLTVHHAEGEPRGRMPSGPEVYRLAQSLPYRLAGVSLAVWAVILTAGGLVCRFALRLEQDDTVLMVGVGVVAAVGGSIYESLWHRDTMRLLLAHLTVNRRLPVRRIKGALSLRTKLLLSFGGLVLFACGMALFWGFAQYKNLVTDFVSRQAGLSLAWLRSEVNAAAARPGEPPTPALVRSVIQRVDRRSIEANAIFYYMPQEANAAIMAVGGGALGAPALPWYVGGRLRLRHDTDLDIDSMALSGRAGRLRVSWQGKTYDLGAVAVLYPDYRGRGESMVRPLRELVLFFLALVGACAGIVGVTVGQFVKPIRWLEQRADGMARGDLAEPVSSGGEGDEIGRLTFALEEMRRALQEKLRSTEEINLELDGAVQRRTADLAKKNRELAETLDKLTRAQDQLVQSEKMASIGQLVAGIAHEINNPVNAIVNTVGPLEEAAVTVMSSDDSAEREEAAEDVRDMIRVVKRGAERTKAIVRALHNYSRTDDEQLVEFDLNRSIDDSLALLRHLLKQNIAVERDYESVGRIRGHAGQLNQVFMNLLTNAAQALAGREGALIRVETRSDDEHVRIRVIDNGAGIPSALLPRIFDPFFTTKEVGEGTGLGLSIVHGLVERHGGSIEVESELGEGTVFTVVLPRGLERARARERPGEGRE